MSRSSAAIVMHISRLFISYSLPKLQIFKILVTIWNFKLRNGRSQQKFHIFELAPWINSSPFHPLKRLKLWEPQSRISGGIEKSKRENGRRTVLCESWRTRVVRLLASKWFSITIRKGTRRFGPRICFPFESPRFRGRKHEGISPRKHTNQPFISETLSPLVVPLLPSTYRAVDLQLVVQLSLIRWRKIRNRSRGTLVEKWNVHCMDFQSVDLCSFFYYFTNR